MLWGYMRPPPPPRAMAGEAFAIRSAYDGPIRMTRGMTRGSLDHLVPRGLKYAVHHLRGAGLREGDYMDACRTFGLAHLLLDVPIREVLAELESRRARGAPPTARELPLMMGEEEREYADAMLDVHWRKVAEAEARAAMEAAPRAA